VQKLPLCSDAYTVGSYFVSTWIYSFVSVVIYCCRNII